MRTRIRTIGLPLKPMKWRRPGSLRTKRPGIWLGMQQSLWLSTRCGSRIVASGSGISACRRSRRREMRRPLTTVCVISPVCGCWRLAARMPALCDLQRGERFLPLPLPSVGPHFGCTVTYSSTNHSSPCRSPLRQELFHRADGEAVERQFGPC
ncbi:hypothetical protein B0H14DRAFT_3032138, partial [Mycena olivaceomarginata]